MVCPNSRAVPSMPLAPPLRSRGAAAIMVRLLGVWNRPKPAPQTYQKFLRLHGVDPLRSAMFEDLARNLVVPHQLGMTTVLVVPDGAQEVVREDWELEGRDADHVDHVTDDLTGFLQKLSATP